MTWRCEREQCGETYPHKHLCDCEEFELVWIHEVPNWWCACNYEEFFGPDDEEGEY